jgi:hypothetical protein
MSSSLTVTGEVFHPRNKLAGYSTEIIFLSGNLLNYEEDSWRSGVLKTILKKND